MADCFPAVDSAVVPWIHRRPARAPARAGVPASAYGVSQVDSEQHQAADGLRGTRPRQTEQHHRRQHLQRSAPPGPRRSRGRAQASGHVHRLHRHPRPDALPVGDHRQRRRRGAGGLRPPGRGDPPRRRLRRGARRRPRHPDRQGAAHRPPGRRGGRDQAPRRRQVRRRLLRRHRRPARRRPLGGQRALVADGHRRRPLAVPAGAQLPPRRPRRLRRRRPDRGVHREVRADPQGQAGRQGEDRHPGPVLARPADLHQGRRLRVRGAARPRPADLLHRPRAGAGDPRPARHRARRRGPGRGEVPPRRRHRRVRGVPRPRRAGDRGAAAAGLGHLHRDRAAARRPGPHDAAGGRARADGRRRRAAGAPATTPRCARSST